METPHQAAKRIREQHTPYIKAIAARPRDPLPRFIYADFLCEHGNPVIGEALRYDAERLRNNIPITKVEDLQGQVLIGVNLEKDNDQCIEFTTIGCEIYRLESSPEENMYIERIVGDFSNLLGAPLLDAEQYTRISFAQQGPYISIEQRFRTVIGEVLVFWYGEVYIYDHESDDHGVHHVTVRSDHLRLRKLTRGPRIR